VQWKVLDLPQSTAAEEPSVEADEPGAEENE